MHRALTRLAALAGLASLGEGSFILLRVVPHEQPWLGGALVALGALLLSFAPLPRITRLPRWGVAAAGAVLALGVLGYQVTRGASWATPKIALIALGLALVGIARFVARPRVANVTAWGAALVGAPLLVWAAQALSKASFAGMTPLELFIEYALLVPMSASLALLHMGPSVDGQVITFATPRGPMSLQVGVACSGIQAMGLFSAILLVYVVAEKPRMGRGALWCAVGLFGVYVVNVVRLVALALVGARWGSDALQWTHANLGWMFFVAWTGVFAWMTMGRPDRAKSSRLKRAPA